MHHYFIGHNALDVGYKLYDAQLRNFLRDDVDLANSVVLLMGDHGNPRGKHFHSRYGARDALNPALFIIWGNNHLTQVQEHALAANQHKIVSHPDLHRTLKEMLLMRLRSGERLRTEQGANFWGAHPRGLSLLRELPEGRTCAGAQITETYCQFDEFVPLSASAVVSTFGSNQRLISVFAREMRGRLLEGGEESRAFEDATDAHNGQCWRLDASHFRIIFVEAFANGNGTLYRTEIGTLHDSLVLENAKRLQIASYERRLKFRVRFRCDMRPADKQVSEGEGSCARLRIDTLKRVSSYAEEPCADTLSDGFRPEFCVCRIGSTLLDVGGLQLSKREQQRGDFRRIVS
jgi:hypothetical protein